MHKLCFSNSLIIFFGGRLEFTTWYPQKKTYGRAFVNCSNTFAKQQAAASLATSSSQENSLGLASAIFQAVRETFVPLLFDENSKVHLFTKSLSLYTFVFPFTGNPDRTDTEAKY